MATGILMISNNVNAEDAFKILLRLAAGHDLYDVAYDLVTSTPAS